MCYPGLIECSGCCDYLQCRPALQLLNVCLLLFLKCVPLLIYMSYCFRLGLLKCSWLKIRKNTTKRWRVCSPRVPRNLFRDRQLVLHRWSLQIKRLALLYKPKSNISKTKTILKLYFWAFYNSWQFFYRIKITYEYNCVRRLMSTAFRNGNKKLIKLQT